MNLVANHLNSITFHMGLMAGQLCMWPLNVASCIWCILPNHFSRHDWGCQWQCIRSYVYKNQWSNMSTNIFSISTHISFFSVYIYHLCSYKIKYSLVTIGYKTLLPLYIVVPLGSTSLTIDSSHPYCCNYTNIIVVLDMQFFSEALSCMC